METRIIDFTVCGQEIEADLTAPAPRGDSQMYLKARFTVDETTWSGLQCAAVFQRRGVRPFCVELDETMTCDFPAEMLATRPGTGVVTVCVGLVGFGEGAYQLPTGKAEVRINPDCYIPGETPPPPTPDVYAQLLERVARKLDANQGAEHVGKALIIGEGGGVVPGGGIDEALEIATETGLVNPIADESGTILTDTNGNILIY